jgi:hypothetical protein
MTSSTRRLQHSTFYGPERRVSVHQNEISLMLKQGNRRVGKESCLKQTGEYLAVEVPQCAVNSTTLGQNPDR